MKVWVISSLYDDSDPGDHAQFSTLKLFGTLEGARSWFQAEQAKFNPDQRGWLQLDLHDETLEELFGPDAPEGADLHQFAHEQAMRTPEMYTWTNGYDIDDEGGARSWNGGTVLEFTEVEVEP